MNRIARRSLAPQLIEVLRSSHTGFIRATGNKVPPSVVSLYAVPEVATDGAVQWVTSLQGNPIALQDLPSEQVEAFKARLFEKLAAISSLAKELSTEPTKYAKEISLLTQAAAAPSVDAIYSVNGQPVLLYWVSALPPDPNRKILAIPTAPVAAAAAVATTALSHRYRWLIALLLFLLLLFLLWWFFCPKSVRNDLGTSPSNLGSLGTLETKTNPPAVAPDDQDAPPDAPLVAPKPIEPPKPLFVVKPSDTPIEVPEPALVEVPEPEPELLRPPTPPPEPVATVVVPPKPEVVPPKVTTPVKPPVPQTITIENAKDVCPEDRPATLAPEMIVVFDASGSMQININATEAEQEWLFKILSAGPNPLSRLSPSERQKFERLHREPTRIVTAKQATVNVIQRLPKDVGTGLVVVDQCPGGARNLGRFSPSQRGQMISRLNQLSPHQGTPLADGLLQGGELADGVTRQSTILLVSDGEESCGGDPCFVARNLKRKKPHLKINVIDIGGTGAASCAAEITGGKVYTVSNVNELNTAVERAAQESLGPAHCRRPN
jgi:hypothetical protein